MTTTCDVPKQVASLHAAVVAETTKKMASDYTAKAQNIASQDTAKAQEMVGPLAGRVGKASLTAGTAPRAI